MTLHLIKLCVGAESVDDLAGWIAQRVADRRAAGAEEVTRHVTRMTPKRGAEIVGTGSLYWVIRGFIQARQPILRLDPLVDADGVNRCAIILSPELIATRLAPRRPFQGWRYLAAEEAPADLTGATGGDDVPEEMRRELAELGLI
ncbi:DUF1489 family protein [Amorphus sp. 3PC139-8]|uniref:DUF1489 family protein n=1 Tax=Amorphus sp. 3PC139-8 TaxID=2735676 RepID=UPI00345D8300